MFEKNEENMKNDEQNDQENPSIEFPTREALENQLTAMEMKVREYKEVALRSQAELENIRRRSQKDVESAHKYGTEKLIQDLLPALDGLSHSLEKVRPHDAISKSMQEGMRLTLELLEKTLLRHGVKVIAPKKGEDFNPHFHQAMSMQSDPDVKSNTILEVMQRGYELNGRVLRPAMVVVSQ